MITIVYIMIVVINFLVVLVVKDNVITMSGIILSSAPSISALITTLKLKFEILLCSQRKIFVLNKIVDFPSSVVKLFKV